MKFTIVFLVGVLVLAQSANIRKPLSKAEKMEAFAEVNTRI